MGDTAIQEKPAEDAVFDAEDHNAGLDFKPLYEDEAISDEDLKGESTEEEPATSEPTGEANKETDETDDGEKPVEEPAEEPAEETGEKPDSDEPDKKDEENDEKPPPNFVPHAALHQERRKAQALAAENAKLKALIERSNVPAEKEDKFKDFKVKTTEEYRELLEEDPDAAQIYQYEYTQYIQHQDDKKRLKDAEKQSAEREREIVAEGAGEIEKLLPGFHEKKNGDVQKIADFAVESGFDPDVLFDMTNPGTRIVNAKNETYTLGVGAAQLIKMIQTAYAVPNVDSIRTEVEAELKPKLEAEIQSKLLKKLKSGQDFKSLDNATSSSAKDVKPITGVVSEAEFAAKSEAEQRELLGG